MFGSVIEVPDNGVGIDINHGHAVRYDALAEIDVADGGGAGVISLFRARPLNSSVLKLFERHPLGSQTFLPAGAFDPAKGPLFRADAHQGVHYLKGTWHHFLLVLEAESEFIVIDRAGAGHNCDEIELAPADQINVRW